jgi:hypothetical protein
MKLRNLDSDPLFLSPLDKSVPFSIAAGGCAVDAELDAAYQEATAQEYDAYAAGQDTVILSAETILSKDVLDRFRAEQADALYEQTWGL